MTFCCTLVVTLCAALASSSAYGRSLLYYYDFDKVEKGVPNYTFYMFCTDKNKAKSKAKTVSATRRLDSLKGNVV